jgi:toxin ParE1/3/4
MKPGWPVRLGRQAEEDYREILHWTATTFGETQAVTYAETMTQAIEALRDGPDIPGARSRDEIQPGIRVLHVARQGRKGRHLVVFRVGAEETIDVLRLLHDSMDLPSHLTAGD